VSFLLALAINTFFLASVNSHLDRYLNVSEFDLFKPQLSHVLTQESRMYYVGQWRRSHVRHVKEFHSQFTDPDPRDLKRRVWGKENAEMSNEPINSQFSTTDGRMPQCSIEIIGTKGRVAGQKRPAVSEKKRKSVSGSPHNEAKTHERLCIKITILSGKVFVP